MKTYQSLKSLYRSIIQKGNVGFHFEAPNLSPWYINISDIIACELQSLLDVSRIPLPISFSNDYNCYLRVYLSGKVIHYINLGNLADHHELDERHTHFLANIRTQIRNEFEKQIKIKTCK